MSNEIKTVKCQCGESRRYRLVSSGYINFPAFVDSKKCTKCGKYYRPGDLIDAENWQKLRIKK